MPCLFCDFISGKRKTHLNGFPFETLHESKHSISFLSIDFPATEDGHILVIPKEHFESIEEISDEIFLDLTRHLKLISKILRNESPANNILLNNGAAAGQQVFHAHFHLIPRNPGDQIQLEGWTRKNLADNEFTKLHQKLRQFIEKEISS